SPPSWFRHLLYATSCRTNGPHVVGILAFQLPIDNINAIMTGNRQWKHDGLGDSGETYLVGSDLRMRSISRFLIEDKAAYLAQLRDLGTPGKTVQRIDQLDTSILLQKIDTDAAREAFDGKEGTRIVNDYRGIAVLSSYRQLNLEGLSWAILSEMDLAEIYRPIAILQRRFIIWTVILMALIVGAAAMLSSNFERPVRALIEGARKVETRDHTSTIDLQMRNEFGELAQMFNDMVLNLRRQQARIE
uniref:HAMP domain-containing protein n=1 Tax=Candidatus Entotheonella palauensis TaxID=93172 RepID=UPI001C4DE303